MSADDNDAAGRTLGDRRRRRRAAGVAAAPNAVTSAATATDYNFGYGSWSVSYGAAPTALPMPAPSTDPSTASDPVDAQTATATAEHAIALPAPAVQDDRPEAPEDAQRQDEPKRPAQKATLRERLTGRRPPADEWVPAPPRRTPTTTTTTDGALPTATDSAATDSAELPAEDAARADDTTAPAPPFEHPNPEQPHSGEAGAEPEGAPLADEQEPLVPPPPSLRERLTRRAGEANPAPHSRDEPAAGRRRERLRRPSREELAAARVAERREASLAQGARLPAEPGPGLIAPDMPISQREDDEQNRRAQRIEGGGTVVIGNQLFELIDWSALGLSIRSDQQLYRVGDVEALELEVDLGDYAVNLDLQGEVVNRNSQRTGWRFREPTEIQRQVLRGLTHASTSSRAFTPPRPTAPTERGGGAKANRSAATPARRRNRFSLIGALMSLPFNAAIIALISGLAILAMSGGQLPTVAPDGTAEAPGPITAESAAVAVRRVTLISTASGLLLEWAGNTGELFEEGDALVSLTGDANETEQRVVLSPCDCYLARIIAQEGERVQIGATIAMLYPRDAEGHVQAMFGAGEAPNVGDEVLVTLPYSNDTITGTVTQVGRIDEPDDFIGLPATQLRVPGGVYARIATVPPLPAALAGSPVIVTAEARRD